jgi:hypothetical protein
MDIIGALSHAEMRARNTPSASDEIEDRMRRFARRDLESQGSAVATEFVNAVDEISNQNQMPCAAGR